MRFAFKPARHSKPREEHICIDRPTTQVEWDSLVDSYLLGAPTKVMVIKGSSCQSQIDKSE